MKHLFILILGLSILISSTTVTSDVIIPTKTFIYFEDGGQPYNEEIDFTVKCYGFNHGNSLLGTYREKPETYTPEIVKTFSSDYHNYGYEINENFYSGSYSDQVSVDYCIVEATKEGTEFTIGRYDTLFGDGGCFGLYCKDGICYKQGDKAKECLYDKEMPDDVIPNEYCKEYFIEMTEEEMQRLGIDEENTSYELERLCELKYDLKDVTEAPPVTESGEKNFLEIIICFFVTLFGGSC